MAFTTLNPVWAGAHDLEFEFEFEFEIKKISPLYQKRSNANISPALSPSATDAFGKRTYSFSASTR